MATKKKKVSAPKAQPVNKSDTITHIRDSHFVIEKPQINENMVEAVSHIARAISDNAHANKRNADALVELCNGGLITVNMNAPMVSCIGNPRRED